jgi:tetratricopeptide (TPR) repeat protein
MKFFCPAWLFAALCVAPSLALALFAFPIHRSGGSSHRAESVTFNRNVAPIIFHYCSPCHRPGEAAPFPLLSYQDTVKFAAQIAVITRSRIMPPWLPSPSDLKFAGDLHLSDEQIAVLQEWVDQGAREGDPHDLPPAPEFTPGWQLGKPEVVLHARKPYELPASGTDNYWNFIFPTNFPMTRWIRAIEIRPGEKHVVHHANILIDRLHSSRALEQHPGDGFPGMELRIESESFDPDSHIFFWKPGSIPHEEPEGMALRLDPGDDLVLNTHLQPSGKPETIDPSIGLYFTDTPATRFPVLLELQNDQALDIPAGDANFEVTEEFTLPTEVQLLAIYPHAHYLGKDLLATATFPDGSIKTLIHIPRWDLNWQAVFYYDSEVILPAQTRISMRYIYDNSKANIANPFNPPRRVQGGNRTTDEMAHLWLQVLPHGDAIPPTQARFMLQEAMARHDVSRNPDDFAAQYNLGAMLQARSDFNQALPHFQTAVQLRPSDAIANNALGGAYLGLGNPSAAVAPLLLAVRNKPDYFSARYNLGNAYASLGKFDEAIAQFSAAAQLNPSDSMAEANLGAALAEAGKLAEAQTHLERALKLDPQNSLAQDNLEEVKHRRSSSASP